MIESNIIYNFEDFRALVSDKAKEGTYYLLYDDLYFISIIYGSIVDCKHYL